MANVIRKLRNWYDTYWVTKDEDKPTEGMLFRVLIIGILLGAAMAIIFLSDPRVSPPLTYGFEFGLGLLAWTFLMAVVFDIKYRKTRVVIMPRQQTEGCQEPATAHE